MFTQNCAAFASINGIITRLEDARIGVTDRGLLFGHALFETILVKNRKMIAWNEHYERLQLSCKKIFIPCPEKNILKRDCLAVVRHMHDKTFAGDLNLKIVVTGGNYSGLTVPARSVRAEKRDVQGVDFNVYILCQKAQILSLSDRMRGITVKSFQDERGMLSREIKSTNYLFNFLCVRAAREEGFDDALFRSEEGFFTEGATSSFLWFESDNMVCFSPPKSNCLAGTSVLKLIKKLQETQISYKYQMLHKNDAINCAGCAMISSIRGFVPIKQIDHMEFNLQVNPLHKLLIEMLYPCE